MGRFDGFKGLLIRLALVGLLWEIGCSRQVGVPSEEGTDQTAQTPFHEETPSGNSSAPSEFAMPEVATTVDSLPFHEVQSLPAGTLLVVRLKSPISSVTPSTRDSFEATLDASVTVDGNTLIARGADVIGRVESSRTSQVKPGRGYIQLALQSIRVGEVDVPVQTASLFVRPSAQKDHSAPITHLEKGHQLTFRLIQPVYASNQTAQIVP